MLIDGDGDAGKQFTLAAWKHADDLVGRYATDVLLSHTKKPGDTTDLDAAAALYGLADAGARQSANTEDECVNDIPCMNAYLARHRAAWAIQNTVIGGLGPHSPYPPQLLGPDGQLLWFDDLSEAEKYSSTWGRILDENMRFYGVFGELNNFETTYRTVNTFR